MITACDSPVMSGEDLYALSVMGEPHPHGAVLGARNQGVAEGRWDGMGWDGIVNERRGGYRDDSVR